MRVLPGLLVAFLLVVAAAWLRPQLADGAGAAVMALGFVLLVSFALGGSAARLGLPSITGYIFVGFFFGPHLLGAVHPALGVLGREAISALQLLDAVAPGLIALTAGGELRLSALRAHGGAIGGVISGQVVLVLSGVTLLVLAAGRWFPELAVLSGGSALAVALLFGVTALANSPAVVLAVVQDCRARGPMADVVLAVTVAKDVVVTVLFTVVLALAGALAGPGVGLGGQVLLRLGWEVAGSVGMGLLLGWLAVQYLQRMGQELPLLVLGVAFAAVTMLPDLHLSGVLACLVAGFYIENFSGHGDDLIKAIERHALPVYVVFFTIAGAGLDVEALRATWPLALFLAGARLGLTVLGTAVGGALGGARCSATDGAASLPRRA